MVKLLRVSHANLSKDLHSKVFVVTGGNSGIGLATAWQLARQGATVVLGCRKLHNGGNAKGALSIAADINAACVRGNVSALALDLSSLESVRHFAEELTARHHEIHGLVNNAGVMNTPRGLKTKDGFDMQLGTNHLGHFLLTSLLLEPLQRGAPSRIVCVSSCYAVEAGFGFFRAKAHVDLEDLHFERRPYNGWAAYAQSKLANVLHAKELSRRLHGTGVTAVSLHPGVVQTNIVKNTIPCYSEPCCAAVVRKVFGCFQLPAWEGAQTTLHCLLDDSVAEHPGGFFVQAGDVAAGVPYEGGWPVPWSAIPHENERSDAVAVGLWEESERLVA